MSNAPTMLLSSPNKTARPFLKRFFATESLAIQTRPRLVALRTKLENEAKQDPAKTPTPTPTITITSKTTSPTLTHQVLQRIRSLPTPDRVLTDRFDRAHSYLRISLTERCNLRCRYCMPPEGVPLQPESHLLQRQEIIELARIFVKNGVDKIRLTGGEPLLRKDLAEIVSDLALLDGIRQIGMTTNGISLQRQLPTLLDAGMTHVNISLDTLLDEKFVDLTRRPGLGKVMRSIEAAAATMPAGRVKINCVVMRNINEDELVDFCRLTEQFPVDVRFIEWMPFADNSWSKDRFVSYDEMLRKVDVLGLKRAQDGPNDTTKWWRTAEGMGRIGFITSMSQHFCGTCNRLRLTADGRIKACLFGAEELSLRDILREGASRQDIEKLIHCAVQRKHFALGGHGTPQGIADANDNRPMTLIGG